MFLNPVTERAIKDHWGKREFFDTLIVRDIPVAFPSIFAALRALKVAERHRCQRIIVDKGSVQHEFPMQQVYEARFRYMLPNRPEMGVAEPEDREARRQNWPVGVPVIGGADSLPKGD